MTIAGRTRVFGLIGQPVAHSLSPRLMNAAFARLGVDAVYVAFPTDPERTEAAVRGLAAAGVAGVNVTTPLKAAVLPALASVSPAVRAAGAANVLVSAPGGGFDGENTDAGGLVLALRERIGFDPSGRRAAIVGAGGAARATAHGLREAGLREAVFLVRDPERAAAGLAGLRAAHHGDAFGVASLGSAAATAALASADLVVQAAPVGRDDPDGTPIVDPRGAAPGAVGFELVYGERPTSFSTAWEATGRPHLDGRDLLAAQAHLALRLWLGEAPDLATMLASIADAAAGRTP